MYSRIRTLETRIEALKGQIVAMGDLRPGSLLQQYNVCGTPNCRCKASPPQKHGPRYELSYTRKGKSGTRLVKRHDWQKILYYRTKIFLSDLNPPYTLSL